MIELSLGASSLQRVHRKTIYLYHKQRSYKGKSDFRCLSLVKWHSFLSGKLMCTCNNIVLCVFSIKSFVMNSVSFALGAALSLVVLISMP